MPSLLLFDIDGTLLLSGRAGLRAMTRTCAEVFGVSNGFSHLSMSGRTDRWLVRQALDAAGLPPDDAAHERFRAAYLARLAEEIHRPGEGRKTLMPGVTPLLEALAAADGVHTALLTGNYREGARIKLEYFGVDRYFPWGAFGDDHEDRNALGAVALAEARRAGVPDAACANTIVIGDTPHDVACAAAAGARAVAVATGSHSVDDLRAAGADVVLSDLSDTDAVLRLLV